jgi:hypothetical protein
MVKLETAPASWRVLEIVHGSIVKLCIATRIFNMKGKRRR